MSQALSNVQKLRDIVDATLFLTPAQARDVKSRTGLLAVSTALTAGLASAAAAGASEAYFCSGNWTLDGIGVQVNSPIILRGAGPQKTILRQTSANGNGVTFAYASLLQGGGVTGMTVEAGAGWMTAGFTGVGSTGVGIAVENANDLFVANDFGVNNFDYGITVKGCYQTRWQNFRVLFFTARGIQVDKSSLTQGAGNLFTHAKVSNFGFSGTVNASRGIDLQDGGGDYFTTLDVTSCGNGIVVAPPTGRQVLYARFTDVLADTCVFDNWVFDGTNGKVWETSCTACWGSYSTDGSGLSTTGANLVGLQWNGGQLRENGLYGWIHGGGASIQMDGVRIVHNSKKTSNTYAGAVIAGGVSGWAIRNCRIGNDGSSSFVQADGIKIDAGVSGDFIISGNDLRSAGSGKVGFANGSSVLNWIVADNLPLQAVGNNTSNSVALTGRLATAAAGATTSLGTSLIAQTYVLSQFYVKTDSAPGVGQTFTYYVYVNGTITTMTGVISGASNTTVAVIANPQILSKNDVVELRVTTSGGAAVTAHLFYITQEP